MSLHMTTSRWGNCGDPGLFGFLGNAIKGVAGGFLTGGPVGAILGGTSAVVGSMGGPKTVKQAKYANILQIAQQKPIYGTPGIMKQSSGAMFPTIAPARPALQAGSGVYAGPGGVAVGKYNMAPGGSAPQGSAAAAGTPCGLKGHHMNKSGYYTQAGYVAPQTKCVRNRRRNPLNPRALSRAMSRVASAQRAVKAIQLFAGAPARAAAKGKGKQRRGGRR